MTQLSLFAASGAKASQMVNQFAYDPSEIGGALHHFVQFCREHMGAKESRIALSLLLEDAWKTGRHHPYLKAWDKLVADGQIVKATGGQ